MRRWVRRGRSHNALRPKASAATMAACFTRRHRFRDPSHAPMARRASPAGACAGWRRITAARRGAASSGGASRAFTPAYEREGHEREETPSEPRRDQTPSKTLLDPASRPRRQGQGHEGAGQGQPATAEHAREEGEGGDTGKDPGDPDHRLVGSLDIESAQRRRVNDGAEPRRTRRVILELGVTGPPAGIQAPGQPAELDGVMEAIELAGMIVEDEQDRCRARSGRRSRRRGGAGRRARRLGSRLRIIRHGPILS